jgi:hypothetical protein
MINILPNGSGYILLVEGKNINGVATDFGAAHLFKFDMV